LNWVLMLACLTLVIGFRSSTRLAAAYGLAVSGTMFITTLLFISVARARWKWSVPRVSVVAGGFLLIDLSFLGANVLKIPAGGWIPLVIGGVVFLLLDTWYRGRHLLRLNEVQSARRGGIEAVLASLRDGSAARVRGTAVYMHSVPTGLPRTLLHNLKHNRVLHERVIFLTVTTEDVSFVPLSDRVEITMLAEGFWRVIAHYGFRQEPDVPDILELAAAKGLEFRKDQTTYFLGRETIISAPKPGMARWRERLFGIMVRNARPATSYFRLPPDRVVELGTQVEI
jgi:KUP system potassium uptake protein